MENLKNAAEHIITYIGGEENIVSVSHCMTRLRFVLIDNKKVEKKALEKLPAILKIVEFGGQLQLIIGNEVDDVYEEILKIGSIEQKASGLEEAVDSDSVNEDSKKTNPLEKLITALSGIFVPILPAMIGMGFLKCLCVILNQFIGIPETNSTYLILFTLADGISYFMPFLIAYSAAQRFHANVGIAISIAALLLHPNFIAAFSGETGVNFIGLPVTSVSYSSSVLPMILSVYLLSKTERILKKFVPKVLQTMLVPFASLLITAPLTILVLGPIGVWGGNLFVELFNIAQGISPILAGFIVGGLWQLLIICGMHLVAINLIGIPGIIAYGRDYLGGMANPSCMCQVAAGLGVALRLKNKEGRKLARELTITSFFGTVVEPVMYGVNLKYKKPFYFSMLGGAIGGAIAGAAHAGATAPVALSIYSFPAYFGEGFVGLLIGTCIGCLVTFLLTYFFGVKEA